MNAIYRVLTIVAATLAVPASATVLYNQEPTLTGAGASADTGHLQSYDSFSLSAAADLTDIFWSGSGYKADYSLPEADGTSFTVRIYGPGFWDYAVGSLLDVRTVVADAVLVTSDVYSLSAHLQDSINLAANTRYWLSITSDDLYTGPGSGFMWGLGNGDDGLSLYGSSAQAGINEGDLGFRLESNPVTDVPEPAALGLFGLGVIGLGLTRRRSGRS